MKNEVLLGCQIDQHIEADVNDIYIVVGFMKENFFYHELEYPQFKLLVNNNFVAKGNLYSLYSTKDYLFKSYRNLMELGLYA